MRDMSNLGSNVHSPRRTVIGVEADMMPLSKEEVTLAPHVYCPKSERLTLGILKEVVAMLTPELMETTVPSGFTKNTDTVAFRKEGTVAVQLALKEPPMTTVPLVLLKSKSAGKQRQRVVTISYHRRSHFLAYGVKATIQQLYH